MKQKLFFVISFSTILALLLLASTPNVMSFSPEEGSAYTAEVDEIVENTLASKTPDITPVIEKYRAYIQDAMRQKNTPGLAIVVVDDQKILWQEGFGYTDTDRRIPVTPDTPFGILSMSKQFTALTVLMAVQDGLLDLDTPLSSYLPDFRVNSIFEPDAADRINLRNLLSNTAGFTHDAPVGNNFELESGTFETHIASIQDTWLKFPVGQMYSYSNLGNDLAGYIVQKKTGMPFAQYAQEKLFAPLGMTHSSFDIDAIAKMPDRALGQIILINEPPLVAMMPSGGLYTTAADMAHYLQFHINGGVAAGQQLISPELLQTMYTPQFLVSASENYGLGIRVRRNHDARMLWFTGGGFGFNSSIGWYPELKLGIAILTNSQTYTLIDERLQDKILDDIVDLDPALYARRAGTKPPADVRLEQNVEVLSDSALLRRIEAMAPTPTSEELAEWRSYTGIYGLRTYNNITQLMHVELQGNFLTLDGKKIYGFGSGLFFLPNGEALNLASEPPTYRNIPLQKLNPVYFWFLRGISAMSLFVFLGALMSLPVIGVVALFRRIVAHFRRRPVADQEQSLQSRGGFPGWLTGLLVWLAALLGVLALLASFFGVMLWLLKDNGIVDMTPENILGYFWSQYPALIYGYLPHFNPGSPWYVQLWLSLPFAIFLLAAIAGVGTWQAWCARRWSKAACVLLTVVIALQLIMAVLIW